MNDELPKLVAEVSRYIAESGQGGGSESQFNDLALRIFALQFAENLPYSKYCRSIARTPQSVGTWQQIPAMVTSAFKDLDLTIVPADERSAVFHSSGTTQQKPSRHYHNRPTLGLYELSLLSWFKPHFGLGRSKRPFLFLTPGPSAAPNSSLVHMFSTVGCDLATEYVFASDVDGGGGWSINVGKVHDFVRARSEPLIVCGTAFSYVHLFDALGCEKLPLPAGSRILETGGYKGRSRVVPKEELHRMIAKMFAVPASEIVCEYGMSELSSQAYSTGCAGAGGAFQFPPWARAQVISPESGKEVSEGEAGLLRVFDLANVGSVLAIQTEDVAVRRGTGFELLGRATASEARGCSLMAA